MRSRWFGWWSGIAALALGALACAQACSSSSSSSGGSTPASCADNPSSCAAGTTCWPKDCSCSNGACDAATCTVHMACLPSAAGKNPHDFCENKAGVASCGDRQACYETSVNRGACLLYCDDSKPNRGCPDGEVCFDGQKVGSAADAPVIHVCAVAPSDGGSVDGGGGPDDGGTVYDVRTDLPM